MSDTMQILTKDEFLSRKTEFHTAIRKGAVFVYPTDTIYGLGCNAQDSRAVMKIREIKQRSTSPFSVIAPSKEWIRENCVITEEAEQWLKKLPGPYTLILRMKNRRCVAKEVTPGQATIGVRIPDHCISKTVAELNMPIVTTSVNKAGKAPMISPDTMDPDIKKNVDFTIDEEEKKGRPSTLVHLEGKEVMIHKRSLV